MAAPAAAHCRWACVGASGWRSWLAIQPHGGVAAAHRVDHLDAIGGLVDDLFPLDPSHALGAQRVEDFCLRRQRLQGRQRIAVAGKRRSRSSSETLT
jgi:hypothetical protein